MIDTTMGIALLAVIVGGTVNAFAGIMSQYAFRGAAGEIFARLQWARMAAVKKNSRFTVSVVDAYHYQVHDDANSNSTVESGESVSVYDIRKNGPGVSLTAGSVITFAPTGAAPASGAITVSGAATQASLAVLVSPGGRIWIR